MTDFVYFAGAVIFLFILIIVYSLGVASGRASEIEEREQHLFESVDGDLALEQILSALMDGCEPKPRFLAEKLGISIQETNNHLKRLRRRISKVQKGEVL